LYFEAFKAGRLQEGQDMIRAVGALRPTFEMPAELDQLPAAVMLADGPSKPRLICISAPVLTGGVHQYARIAAHFRGKRQVSALPLVGFEIGESLPATAEAACRVIAESVLEASQGEPFVLVGHSSGGALALSVAGMLEQTWGIKAEAVVMLDTLTLHQDSGENVDFFDFLQDFYLTELGSKSGSVMLSSARLSAMGHWFSMLTDLVMHPTTARTLLVRCAEPLPGVEFGNASTVSADTVSTIEADHFSLAMEDSAVTAQVIDEWLGTFETVRP
jgi:hypothetical protein